MIRFRSLLSLLSVACVVWAAIGFTKVAVAQESLAPGNSVYERDELIEVEVLGKWTLGQIVKETSEGSGNFRVVFHHDGKRVERTYPESKIRRLGETPLYPISPLRNWYDTSGKHSVQARLMELTEDVCVLMKQDGKEIEVPLEKLAAKDRIYARNMALAAQQKEVQDSNYGYGGDRVAQGRRGDGRRVALGRRNRRATPQIAEAGHGGSNTGDVGDAGGRPARATSDDELAAMLGADEPAPTAPAETETHGARADLAAAASTPAESAENLEGSTSPLGNLASVGTNLLAGGESGADPSAPREIATAEARTVEVDPNKPWELIVEPPNATSWDDLILDLPSVSGDNVSSMSLVVDRSATRAVALFVREAADPIVADVTMDQPDAPRTLTATGLNHLFDISPDGQRVLGLSGSQAGEFTLGIWSLQGDSATRQVTLKLPGWTTIHDAVWFDDSHALVHVDDQVVQLQLEPTANVPYAVQGATGMAVSPTRTQVAIQRADGILFLDALTGNQVGWISFQSGPPTAMSIAPDGTYLVTFSTEGLALYDLASGQQLAVTEVPEEVRRLDAITNDFVLLNVTSLFRVADQKSIRTIEFQSPEIARTMRTTNGAVWYLVPPDPQGTAQVVRVGLLPTELEARQKDGATEFILGRGGKTPR